ncbi:MAG: arsenate reductase ArsC [Candidatus Brocadiia bacterium]
MSAPRSKVLFVCTGNSARSQMAEALLRTIAGERYEAFSAGTEPADVHPLTIRVLQEIGCDTSPLYSKSLDAMLAEASYDFIITVCDRAAETCPVVMGGGARIHWSFEDPAAFEGTEDEKVARFRRIRDLVESRIRRWLTDVK